MVAGGVVGLHDATEKDFVALLFAPVSLD